MSHLKVIGAGLPRTGTHSSYDALGKLGYRSHHMVEVFAKGNEHALQWMRAFEAKAKGEKLPVEFWNELLKDYTATLDAPSCCFYEELMEIAPDAKVLLTVRDPQKWVVSVRETVGKIEYDWFFRLCRQITALVVFRFRVVGIMLDQVWGLLLYDRDPTLPVHALTVAHDEKMKKIFTGWTEEVKRVVPKERLLVFEVKEGWKPLCEFLGKPIPNEPFPNVNDTASIKKRLNVAYYIAFGVVGVTGLACWGAFSAARYYLQF